MKWTGWLISFAVLLQSIEMLWIPHWPWKLVEREFPKWIRPIFSRTELVIWCRLLASLWALFFLSPLPVFVMLVATWLLSWRWRGTLNGGSDAMTFQILLALALGLAFPNFERAALFYIAIQLMLSYVVAGLVKVLNKDWRSGVALNKFIGRYGGVLPLPLAFILSWGLIGFELAFPFAAFAPWGFLVVGVFFHLANVYFFGLNRFFFAWLAGYPALFYVAQSW